MLLLSFPEDNCDPDCFTKAIHVEFPDGVGTMMISLMYLLLARFLSALGQLQSRDNYKDLFSKFLSILFYFGLSFRCFCTKEKNFSYKG